LSYSSFNPDSVLPAGKIERNEVAPAWATIRSIARALDISMRELGAAVDRQG